MKCPYCNQEMKIGSIYPLNPKSSNEIYWLPEHSNIKGIFLSKKKIIECGGLVLGENDIFSEGKLSSHYCEKCKILFTKLND